MPYIDCQHTGIVPAFIQIDITRDCPSGAAGREPS